jgi:hypothetical protein
VRCLSSREAVREAIDATREVGFDELILFATIADPKQVDLIANAAGVG